MRRQALKRKKSFQKSFVKHGATSKALRWRNKESARIQHANIVADVDFENKSISDIGCGFGDIIPFIKAKTRNFDYVGIDVVPEFTKEAKRRYPEYRFLTGDWMELIEKRDIVLCSGVLNNKVDGDQYKYRKDAIFTMYENANEIFAFNMQGSSPQPKNRDKYRVYYVDSMKILKYCLSLTRRVILRHQYKNKDFTIVMFKKEK